MYTEREWPFEAAGQFSETENICSKLARLELIYDFIKITINFMAFQEFWTGKSYALSGIIHLLRGNIYGASRNSGQTLEIRFSEVNNGIQTRFSLHCYTGRCNKVLFKNYVI